MTIKPNSIEEIIKDFYSKGGTEMDIELTRIFVTLIKSDKKFKLPEKDKPFLFKLIEKRIKFHFSFQINDDRLLLFLVAICQEAGTAITSLWYIQYWCFTNKVVEIDLDLFAYKIMPNGLPPSYHLSELWKKQKYIQNETELNLFDNVMCGQSILHF